VANAFEETSLTLPPNTRWIAIAGAVGVVLIAMVAYFVAGGTRGCSSREDVIARVGRVSSGLQEAAAQGRIKVENLASGIKRMNEASTAYEKSGDHGAYCEALDTIGTEFQLGN
jgi:hypothetical protein